MLLHVLVRDLPRLLPRAQVPYPAIKTAPEVLTKVVTRDRCTVPL